MRTKEVQGKLWSSAPQDWAKYVEPTFIPMYQSVLKRLPVDEQMLLDAGCGSGLFLKMASAAGAWISGIDAATGLLEISKKRLPDTTLLVADLEAMPFGDETFDVVTGFNSFQYAGSFENALAEARRVTKKQGNVVIGIWGKEERCEAGTVLQAVANLLPPLPPGIAGPLTLSEERIVEAISNEVGLKVIEKHTVFCPWQFSGDEALQEAFLCTAPCAKAAQIVGELRVRKTITQSAQPYNLADDVYFMRNDFIFFITEKI